VEISWFPPISACSEEKIDLLYIGYDIINEADLRRLKLDLCDPFELILYDLGAWYAGWFIILSWTLFLWLVLFALIIIDLKLVWFKLGYLLFLCARPLLSLWFFLFDLLQLLYFSRLPIYLNNLLGITLFSTKVPHD
jgi:hypothetical protein